MRIRPSNLIQFCRLPPTPHSKPNTYNTCSHLRPKLAYVNRKNIGALYRQNASYAEEGRLVSLDVTK